MSYEFDAPETLDSEGTRCTEPGTYHLVVMDILDGLMPDGSTHLTGGGFSVVLSVLDGTVQGQKDKTIGLAFGNPKSDASDKAKELARAKKGALFIATDLMTPAQLGKSGLKIELDLAKGRQLVATIERDSREGKEKFLQLSYANIYHVDDPRAAKFPKSQEALALIPKQLRHDAAYFEPLHTKGKSSTSSNAQAAGGGSRLSSSQLAGL